MGMLKKQVEDNIDIDKAQEEQRKAAEREAQEAARSGNAAASQAAQKTGNFRTQEDLRNAQRVRDSYMNPEDIDAEAKEFVENGEGQDLTDYKKSYGSPNADATQEAVDRIQSEQNTQNNPPADFNPAQTTKEGQEAVKEIAETPEVKEQALGESIQRLSANIGVAPDQIQDFIQRFMKGQLPKDSKPFMIVDAVFTSLSNIAERIAASNYNHQLWNVLQNNHIDPNIRTSAMEEWRAKNLADRSELAKGLTEKLLEEEGTTKGREEAKQSKQRTEKGEEEVKQAQQQTRIGEVEADNAETYGKESARLSVEAQRLANQGANLDNMNKQQQINWFDKMMQMDYDTKKAALMQLKFGSIKGTIDILGNKVEADAASIMNLVESGKATLDQVFEALKGKFTE